MDLTKEQTLQIFANQAKVDNFSKKYKFSTKYKWYCLSCGTIIYMSYKQYSIINIFCDTCYPRFHKRPTIVQVQYMMKLKSLQLELVEKQHINFENDNDIFPLQSE